MSYLLYMIIQDLSIHIVPYLIRTYVQTITTIKLSWVDFYRVDFELSSDTRFDLIEPVFLEKKT